MTEKEAIETLNAAFPAGTVVTLSRAQFVRATLGPELKPLETDNWVVVVDYDDQYLGHAQAVQLKNAVNKAIANYLAWKRSKPPKLQAPGSADWFSDPGQQKTS